MRERQSFAALVPERWRQTCAAGAAHDREERGQNQRRDPQLLEGRSELQPQHACSAPEEGSLFMPQEGSLFMPLGL